MWLLKSNLFTKITGPKATRILLNNRTILLVSPQSWGKMLLSKHHYAIALAKRGNIVYFLNPPEENNGQKSKRVIIEQSGVHKNLFLIHHHLAFPYNIKFHFIKLFHALMKPHIKNILKKIGKPVDIIWSFDLGNLYPFQLFPAAAKKIFHPVDEPQTQAAIDSARGAQIIFSVTNEILDKYKQFGLPEFLIHHGLAEEFLLQKTTNDPAGGPIRIGMAGNLLRPDIDREILLQIICENKDVIFEFWGAFKASQSNIGGDDTAMAKSFIAKLHQHSNTVFHGVKPTEELASAFRQMDAFLICYDISKDQSGGTNYHKVMEYLSTGKVIISNNVTTYKDMPELVQMTIERDSNNKLPALFKKIIGELPLFNSMKLKENRINFARENTYHKQVDRIAHIIYGN
jgi:hypothetical protein